MFLLFFKLCCNADSTATLGPKGQKGGWVEYRDWTGSQVEKLWTKMSHCNRDLEVKL